MKPKTTTKKKAIKSYNPVEVALDLKNELDLFKQTQDRKPLITALKEQFLVARYSAATQAEKSRHLGLELLFERMSHMSDNMLLRTIRELSEVGALDLQTITGVAGGGKGPLVSMQQIFGHMAGGIKSDLPSVSSNSESNVVKDTGMLLEALEHIANHFRDKELITIEDKSNKTEEDL